MTTKERTQELIDLELKYGCPNCGPSNIEEIGNNHDKTNNEMEYLEHMKCLNCNYKFVE